MSNAITPTATATAIANPAALDDSRQETWAVARTAWISALVAVFPAHWVGVAEVVGHCIVADYSHLSRLTYDLPDRLRTAGERVGRPRLGEAMALLAQEGQDDFRERLLPTWTRLRAGHARLRAGYDTLRRLERRARYWAARADQTTVIPDRWDGCESCRWGVVGSRHLTWWELYQSSPRPDWTHVDYPHAEGRRGGHTLPDLLVPRD